MEDDFGLEEQERIMREMMKNEMIDKIEAKIKSGDSFFINRIHKMIRDDEENEHEALKMKAFNQK